MRQNGKGPVSVCNNKRWSRATVLLMKTVTWMIDSKCVPRARKKWENLAEVSTCGAISFTTENLECEHILLCFCCTM